VTATAMLREQPLAVLAGSWRMIEGASPSTGGRPVPALQRAIAGTGQPVHLLGLWPCPEERRL
jgi:hypothetical protein